MNIATAKTKLDTNLIPKAEAIIESVFGKMETKTTPKLSVIHINANLSLNALFFIPKVTKYEKRRDTKIQSQLLKIFSHS